MAVILMITVENALFLSVF